MRNVTHVKRQGLQWTLPSILEDLDYADDLGLVASRHHAIKQKREQLNSTVNKIGLKINTKDSGPTHKHHHCNQILVNNKPLEDVEEFTYLRIKVTTTGDCDKDTNTRISKTNQDFLILKSIWRSTGNIHTKIRILNSNVLSVLLYGSE